jgi:hypothetical protein
MRSKLPLGLIFCIAVLPLFAILFPLVRNSGLAAGNDTVVHVGNVVECAYLLGQKLPPFDWVPDVAGGRGGPNYVYYGSLGFLPPAFLVRLGLQPVDALRLWVGVTMVIGFTSAALWCSLFGGWVSGLLGAGLFVWGPYYHGLGYVRGSYPEHLAISLYPLLLYFAYRAASVRSLFAVIAASMVLFLIVAVHTLSLIMIVPYLAVYLLLSAIAMQGPASLRWSMATTLGLGGLAAVLLAPSLLGPCLERGKIALEEQFHSRGATDLYRNGGVAWHSFMNKDALDDIVSRCVPGRVHLLAILGGLFAASRLRDAQLRRMTWAHIGLSIGALLLCEETIGKISLKVFPMLAYLQFPWRFLGLFNLFCAPVFSAAVSNVSPISRVARLFVMTFVPVLCLFVYYRNIPLQEARDFSTQDRESLRLSLKTLDHEDKYMPVGAKLFDTPAPSVLLDIPLGQRFEKSIAPNDYGYSVKCDSEQRAKFHQYWFDGWRAEVDGKPIPVLKDPSDGLCLVTLRQGVHELRLHFVRTPSRLAALAISIAGWGGILIAATSSLLRSTVRQGGLGKARSRTRPAGSAAD